MQQRRGVEVVLPPGVDRLEDDAPVAAEVQLHPAPDHARRVDDRGGEAAPVVADVGVDDLPGPAGVVRAGELGPEVPLEHGVEGGGARLGARQAAGPGARRGGADRGPVLSVVVAEPDLVPHQQVGVGGAGPIDPQVAREVAQVDQLLEGGAVVVGAEEQVGAARGAAEQVQVVGAVGGGGQPPYLPQIRDARWRRPARAVVDRAVHPAPVGGRQEDRGRGLHVGREDRQLVRAAVQVVAQGLPVAAVPIGTPQAAQGRTRVEQLAARRVGGAVHPARLVLAAPLDPHRRPQLQAHAQGPLLRDLVPLGELGAPVAPFDLLPVHLGAGPVPLGLPGLAAPLVLPTALVVEPVLGGRRLRQRRRRLGGDDLAVPPPSLLQGRGSARGGKTPEPHPQCHGRAHRSSGRGVYFGTGPFGAPDLAHRCPISRTPSDFSDTRPFDRLG